MGRLGAGELAQALGRAGAQQGLRVQSEEIKQLLAQSIKVKKKSGKKKKAAADGAEAPAE